MSRNKPNRLQSEQSLYLRQHADNPVNWYPWGEEAFSQAKERDLPIFLSIGYAACHWCHVMEQECFEEMAVADLLNQQFIAIKVDREERPDIDQIYMSVCQAMTGSGGWPLSIFLTPDKKPFYAATYIPRETRGATIGMKELLPHLTRIWQTRREEVHSLSERVLQVISNISPIPGEKPQSPTLITDTARVLKKGFDQEYGGFYGPPKFPSVPQLFFLLRYGAVYDDREALDMVYRTLNAMAAGGIRDQLDGGFHRYATDRAWLLPHFEKMLYDQALLSLIYTEAYQETGEERYRSIARSCLAYMLSSLSDPRGGRYASEDADSQGGEGAYYLWRYDELEALFPNDAAVVAEIYGVTAQGNVSSLHGMHPGDNVLHPGNDPLLKLKAMGVPDPDARLSRIEAELLAARQRRERPLTDDKVLTDWNGLVIRALAFAGMVFSNGDYLDQAKKTAEFILNTMVMDDGRVLHRWRDGNAAIDGTSGDYIFPAWGFLMLYQATGDPVWLKRTISFMEEATDRFFDDENGGYFQTEAGADLPVRMKDQFDGALPSVNGVAYQILRTLAGITGSSGLSRLSEMTEEMFLRAGTGQGTGYCSFLSGWAGEGHETLAYLCGEGEDDEYRKITDLFSRGFYPHLFWIRVNSRTKREVQEMTGPLPCDGSRLAVHFCSGMKCHPPVFSADAVRAVLDGSDVL